jgi:ribosomal protein L9
MAFIAPLVAAGAAAAGGASTIGLIGTAVGAVGSIVSGYQQMQSQKAQAAQMANNAQVQAANARNARLAAGVEEDRQRRANRINQGREAAVAAESGALLSGTALDVAEQNAEEDELDALLIRYQGELRATGFMNQANTQRANSRIMRSNASQSMVGGVIGAGSSLLTGAAKYGDYSAGGTPGIVD